ncbi:MAG: bacillithiol biosynthesis BshC [bacterium]
MRRQPDAETLPKVLDAVPFSPITGAWLAGEPRALALLPRRFDDPGQRAAAAAEAAARPIDPGLLAWLTRRDALAPPDPARAESLATLGRGGAACVVTGQQAGLFGGPLYTLYKAAAAIVDARALTRDTGVPCVPVFWIQSEDHRFVEVASCAVVDTAGALVTARVEPETGAPVSIAARRYGPGVEAALDAIEATLGGGDPAVMALLRRHYRPDASPAEALAGWLGGVFAGTGLLVVDAGDPALAGRPGPSTGGRWRRRMRSTGCWTRGKRRCRTRGSCHRCPCGRGPR